jgi:hypothetical protein
MIRMILDLLIRLAGIGLTLWILLAIAIPVLTIIFA